MVHTRKHFQSGSADSQRGEISDTDYRSRNIVYIPGNLGTIRQGDVFPWSSGQQFIHTNDWYRNLANSSYEDMQRSNVMMPPPLPQWVWTILVTTLGIGPKSSVKRHSIATVLHILTLSSAFLFGISGLFFNAYDAFSEFTRTTLLVCVAKSVLGLYWIGLGIYANILAVRLFSNKRMVDCIRLHSKTFLKVSTAFIVMLLSATVVFVNLYSNQYLLEDQKPSNATPSNDANCVSAGITVVLCRIYFVSKVIYSLFCLMWNLLVVGIFLSVCRTHTISIRRFMKELLNDTKIYVEFFKIQALKKQVEYVQSLSVETRQHQQPPADYQSISDTNIWDDDIVGFDLDTSSSNESPSNAELLQSLRLMRMNTSGQLANDLASGLQDQGVPGSDNNRETIAFTPWIDDENEHSDDSNGNMPTGNIQEHPDNTDIIQEQSTTRAETPTKSSSPEPPTKSSSAEHPTKSSSNTSEENEGKQTSNVQSPLKNQQIPSSLEGRSPPIMTNEELLFTYFQLLRRFSSTSRLLQRWISNWITFVLLWCALLVVYWTSHTAQLAGISQFLIPLVTLGLLTSGYAEVNFEGERLIKCVLPTEVRMPVIYYFENTKLELKIFSFTMTYNTIVTVVAGIAVTFATRIILDQFSLSKGHPI